MGWFATVWGKSLFEIRSHLTVEGIDRQSHFLHPINFMYYPLMWTVCTRMSPSCHGYKIPIATKLHSWPASIQLEKAASALHYQVGYHYGACGFSLSTALNETKLGCFGKRRPWPTACCANWRAQILSQVKLLNIHEDGAFLKYDFIISHSFQTDYWTHCWFRALLRCESKVHFPLENQAICEKDLIWPPIAL